MNKVKLGEVLDVKRGASLSGDYYSESGEKIRLTLGNFDYPNGGFKENTSKSDIYFTGEVKPEFILKKGDIITPLTEQVAGLLGETARIPEDDLYIQSGDVGLVIPNESKLDNKYAYYLLASPLIKRQLGAAAQQTKIRHTSPDKIKDCEAWLPSLEYQKKAGELLDDINFKIKCNNKINAELESMAKTIYDYWFLQFEFPNEDGKPYKSSGGKMVWNEELKREIPEGWEVKDLSKYINVIRGVAYDANDVVNIYQEGYIPLLKSNNLQNGRLLLDDIIYVKKDNVSADQILDRNSVFVTMSSGSTEHVGKTAIIFYDMPYTYGAFCSKIVIQPKYRGFISLFFLSDYFKKKIRTIVVGTSIKNINNSHLTDNIMAFPNDGILERFARIIEPIFNKQGEIIKENQELSSLRDFLLPMLMNGQVGFK